MFAIPTGTWPRTRPIRAKAFMRDRTLRRLWLLHPHRLRVLLRRAYPSLTACPGCSRRFGEKNRLAHRPLALGCAVRRSRRNTLRRWVGQHHPQNVYRPPRALDGLTRTLTMPVCGARYAGLIQVGDDPGQRATRQGTVRQCLSAQLALWCRAPASCLRPTGDQRS
jgi:hypothetical protein